MAELLEPRLLFSADLTGGLLLGADAGTPVEQRVVTEGGEYASTNAFASVTAAPAAAPAPAAAAAVATSYAAMGLSFESNQGQAQDGLDFVAHGGGYGIALQDGNAFLTLQGVDGARTVQLDLVGARDDVPGEGEGLLAGRSNYLVGDDASQWTTGIANYAGVVYRGVYDGIDVRYHGNQRQLEYDFIVAAGADADAIRLRFEGVDAAEIADNGDLVLRVAGSESEVRFKAPVSYQRGEAGLEAVASRYVLHADGSIGFMLGAYDRSRELVIDPVLDYATYFGGTGIEGATAVAVGADGSVYVTGRTTSGSFPASANELPGNGPRGGPGDIFVARLSADLSTVLYSTRIGGSADEQAKAIAVGADGSVVVAGWAMGNFPTLNAADSTRSGTHDGILFKLDAAGALVYSTFFGGTGNTDSGNAVVLDAAGNAYVAGRMSEGGIPIVDPLLSLLFGSSDNAFLSRYSATGGIVFQELFGGSEHDFATGLALGGSGDVFMVGSTESNITMVDGHDGSRGGNIDGFLARMDVDDGEILYSTYVGSNTEDDSLSAVATDGNGNAVVAGVTRARTSSPFFTTPGAMRGTTTVNNADVGFLRVYDTDLDGTASLLYSTFVGGNDVDRPTGVAYLAGRVVVVGQANSTAQFPLTADAHQSTNPGTAMFLEVINPVGGGASDLQYGTFYGSGLTVGGLATAGTDVYVAGGTAAGGYATAGAYRTSPGSTDALVARFSVPNTGPVAHPDTLAATEDTPVTYAAALLLGNDTDANGDALVIASVTSGPGGTAVLNGDGTVTFTPGAGFNGAASFTYTASDGLAVSAPATATVNVAAVNDAPVAGADEQFALRNASTNLKVSDLLANDTDVENATLTITGVTAGTNGTVVLNGNGTVGFTPAANFVGIATFTYTLSDGVRTSTGTVTVHVLAANNDPVAGNDTVNGFEDTPLVIAPGTLLANDSDPEGFPVWIESVTGDAVLNADGSVTFTPPANVAGTFTFNYKITDGVRSDTGTVTVNVQPVNDAPIAVGDALASTPEDTPVTFAPGTLLGNDSDPEGTPLAIGSVGNAVGGTVVLNANGSVTFTPTANYAGPASFTYTATDGLLASAPVTASFTVTPVNDAPSSTPVTLPGVAEDSGTLTITRAQLLANATDPDTPIASLVVGTLSASPGSGALVDNGNGTWSFTPAANFNGTVTFTYTIGDGALSTAASASLAVAAVNDVPTNAPVVLPDAAEDGSVTITAAQLLANANDVETPAGLVVVGLTPSSGSIVDNLDGTWTFTPAADFNGTVTFTYAVSDGVDTAAGSAGMTVTAVNDAPTTSPVTLPGIAEDGGTVTITAADLLVNAADIDSPAASLVATGMAASSGSLVDHGDGTWSFTPALDFNGTVTFTYQVGDGTAATAATATLEVAAVNDVPVTSNVILPAAAEDGAVTITKAQLLAQASDVETATGSLVVAGLTASRGSVVDNGDGTWTFTPAPDDDGAVTFTYTVGDGTATVAGTASLDLLPVNDAPTAVPVTLPAAAEDGAVLITAAQLLAGAGDVDNATLSILDLVASRGTLVDHNDGTWTFTPALDDDGSVTFTFRVGDGLLSAASSATLDLTPVNDAPVAAPVTLAPLGEDGSRTITQADLLVNATDVDSAALVARNLAVSRGSLVDHGDGTWTYTPAADDDGSVTFSYEVSDGALATAATATLDLLPANDAPVAGSVDLGALAEDGTRTITQAELLAGAVDADGDTLFVTNLVASSGTVVNNGGGNWTYIPAADDDGTVTFTFEIGDGTVLVAGSAALDLSPVNDAPVTAPVDLGTLAEDGSRLITQADLLAGATDIDGGTLVAVNLTASRGSLVDHGNGTWTYTPALHDEAGVSFSYGVSDGTTTVLGSAVLDLLPVNDAPMAAPVVLPARPEDSGPITITAAQLLAGASDVDAGASLTVLNVAASSGTVADNGDGTWSYTPALDDEGSVTFTYTITDGALDVAGSASLDLLPVNDAPTAAPVVLPAQPEDSGPITITAAQLLAGATDIDAGASLSVLDLVASRGTVVDNGDGTWSYTPAIDDEGGVTFTYTITDGSLTAAGAASLDLLPVNDAPVAAPVVLPAQPEDSGTITITAAQLLAGASDVDAGAVLGITNLVASHGTLVDNGDGTWSYTPVLDDEGGVTFTYTVTDGTRTAAGTASLDLLPVNDAPTATPVVLPAQPEDSGPITITAAQLLADATDIDAGASLSVLNLVASSGTLVDNGDGTWSYTPRQDDDSGVTFTYTISDGALAVAGSASLDLSPVNDAPTAPPVALGSLAEEGSRLITQADLLAGASDTEGDALVARNLQVSRGTLIDHLDGTWTYVAATDDDTAVTFSFDVSDGAASVAGSATLDLLPVNDAPTAGPAVDLGAIAEDGGRIITPAELLAGAGDIDGDTLSVTTLVASRGTVTANGDGTWTYTPAADDDGSVTFSYTVTDGTLSAAGAATLDLLPVNDAPATAPVVLAPLAEDGTRLITQADLLARAGDIDGGALVASGLVASSGTLVDNGNGTWTFTPAADDVAGVGFTYTISDGTATIAGSATLDLLPVNDAPASGIVVLAPLAEEGSRLITQADLLALAGDVDGDALVASNLVAGSGTLVNHGNGTWTFTAAADDDGAVTFTFDLSDGTTTVSAGATLDLLPVNDAPTTATVVLAPLAEDGTRLITQADLLARAGDIDGGTLVASGLAASSGTLVDNGNGTWTFTPATDDVTGVSFTYTISDGTATVAAGATLDLLPVNDAPTSGTVVLAPLAEDGSRLITQADLLALAGDIDGDALTAGNLVASSGTLVNHGNGTWTFTAAAEDDGAVTFTFDLSDGTTTVSAGATLDLLPVNDAPTTAPVVLPPLAEDGTRLITQADLLARAGDIDGGALVASGLVASSGTLVDNGNGTWSFTPAADDDSAVSFSYIVSDGTASVAGSATLDLLPVNDAPTSGPVVLAPLAEEGTRTITQADLLAAAGDIDSAALVAVDLIASSGTLVDNGDGTWTFTAARDEDGAVTFSFGITDGIERIAASASLDLLPVNDAPTAAPVVLPPLGEDGGTITITTAQLLAQARDIDSGSLTVANLVASSGTLVDHGDGTWSFTARADDDTAVSFTYTVSDGALATAASASLDLAPVDDAPVAQPVTLPAMPEDGTVTLTAAQLLAGASDIDSSALSVRNLVASSGTLVANGDGTWTFTPAADFHGTVRFSYDVSDGNALAAGSASLLVTPVNDAPVAVEDAVAGTEDTPLVLQAADLLANDRDVDGDAPAIVSVTSGTGGTVTLNADGSITFRPDENFNGLADFTYTASDGSLSAAPVRVAVQVAAVNDAPAISSGGGAPALGVARGENDRDVATITASDVDGPGETLVFSIAGGIDAGRFTIDAATGKLSFADAPDFEGPLDADRDNRYEVVVQVSDGALVASQVISVTVEDGGDAMPGPGVSPGPAPAPAPAPAPSAGPGDVRPAPAPAPVPAPAAPAPGPGRLPDASADFLVPAGEPLQVGRTDGGLVFTTTSPQFATGIEGSRQFQSVVFDRQSLDLIATQPPADLVLSRLGTGGAGEGGRIEDLQRSLRSAAFVDELNRLREAVREDLALDQNISISVASVSLGVSVLYVLWLIRGGVLLGSYLSALPAWRILDPLPVLSRVEDEEQEEDAPLDEGDGREARHTLRGFG